MYTEVPSHFQIYQAVKHNNPRFKYCTLLESRSTSQAFYKKHISNPIIMKD